MGRIEIIYYVCRSTHIPIHAHIHAHTHHTKHTTHNTPQHTYTNLVVLGIVAKYVYLMQPQPALRSSNEYTIPPRTPAEFKLDVYRMKNTAPQTKSNIGQFAGKTSLQSTEMTAKK